MSRLAARGWKGQSILVNKHLTDANSAARKIGIMPAFAHHSLAVILSAAKLAGLAKKRWRDADETRLTISEVVDLRKQINKSFDALEKCLSANANKSMIADKDASDRNYLQYGLIGITALAVVEEAGELSEPLHALAKGADAPIDVRGSIQDEAADLRVWLHLIDTSVCIDPVSTTQLKWDRSVNSMGEVAKSALRPRKLREDEIAASMTALSQAIPPIKRQGITR